MAQQSRNWFFQVTATLIDAGKRFLTLDIPDEQTFRNLTDSVVMKSEVGDRAKPDVDASAANLLTGHVVAANDTQSLTWVAPKNDRTLAVQPHQLPIVSSDSNQTVGAYTGPTVTITEDTVVTSGNTKKRFKLKIPDALLTVLTSVAGAIYASNAEVLAKTAVDKSVKPNQLPTVIQGANDVILDFNDKSISITETGATDHNSYVLRFTSEFKSWLAGKLPGAATSAQALYVAPNGNDTSGNGSIITPYLTLAKAIQVSKTISPTVPVVVMGGTYATITTPLETFNNVITFSDGAIINYSDATQHRFLFTGSLGFSIRGRGIFNVLSANSFFFNYTTNYSKVIIESLSITSTSSLFKIAGGNFAPYAGIRVLNSVISCGSAFTNLFVPDTSSVTLSSDTTNEAIDADLRSNTGDSTASGYYEIVNCSFSGYAIRTKSHQKALSFIKNSRFYHTSGGTSMRYIVQGETSSPGYCLTLDNVIFDNASRNAGTSNIYLRTGSQPLVIRNCVFDRGKSSANTAYTVDSQSAITIYATGCIDTLFLDARSNCLGSLVTNSISSGIVNINTQVSGSILFSTY